MVVVFAVVVGAVVVRDEMIASLQSMEVCIGAAVPVISFQCPPFVWQSLSPIHCDDIN
jgi:hypothetical protein